MEEVVHIEQPRDVVEEVFRDRMTPEFKRNEIKKIIENEVIVDHSRHEHHDVHVHVDEVHSRHVELVNEKPVSNEHIETVGVEYVVHKEHPVPHEDVIEIAIPQFKKHYNTHEF